MNVGSSSAVTPTIHFVGKSSTPGGILTGKLSALPLVVDDGLLVIVFVICCMPSCEAGFVRDP